MGTRYHLVCDDDLLKTEGRDVILLHASGDACHSPYEPALTQSFWADSYVIPSQTACEPFQSPTIYSIFP